MKTKIIPFDLETAKKIQAGEIEGRIVLRKGLDTIRIVCFDAQGGKNASESMKTFMIVLRKIRETGYEQTNFYRTDCRWDKDKKDNRDLLIELPEEAPQTFHTEFPKGHAVLHGNTIICVKEETPKHEFKPFDKVLVREQSTDEWKCDYFSHAQNDGVCTYYVCIGGEFLKCIPYEGNQELVGTTDNPKED